MTGFVLQAHILSMCQVDLPGSEGGYDVMGVSCSSCDVTEVGVALRDD